MRIKIAMAILVLIGLISIFQPVNLKKLRVSPSNEDLVILSRASCIQKDLPKNVHHYGFLPAVDLIIPSNSNLYNISEDMRRLFMVRYMITPDLVTHTPDAPWVIGYFKDHETGLPAIQAASLTIVKDCQNGVFLLKK